MGYLILLVVIAIALTPIIIGATLTRAPGSLNLSRTFRQMVPAEIDGAHLVGVGVYRGYVQPLEAKERTVSDQLLIHELPGMVRSVASCCRVFFCIAMLFLLPVGLGGLAELVSGQPSVVLMLGIPGLALAFGQGAARRRLLTADDSAPRAATAVGIWTILHNVVVVWVVFSGDFFGHSDELRMMQPDEAGVISLLYAFFSFFLGAGLIVAARTMKVWRAARILEIAPPVS